MIMLTVQEENHMSASFYRNLSLVDTLLNVGILLQHYAVSQPRRP